MPKTKKPPEPADPPVSKHTKFCSFCGQSQYEILKLIAGPDSVFICNECVVQCIDLMIVGKLGEMRDQGRIK